LQSNSCNSILAVEDEAEAFERKSKSILNQAYSTSFDHFRVGISKLAFPYGNACFGNRLGFPARCLRSQAFLLGTASGLQLVFPKSEGDVANRECGTTVASTNS